MISRKQHNTMVAAIMSVMRDAGVDKMLITVQRKKRKTRSKRIYASKSAGKTLNEQLRKAGLVSGKE